MSTRPLCVHGCKLGQDSCSGCDQVDETHTPDSVTVVPSWSDRPRSMCRVCGRNSTARIHPKDTP